MYDSGTISLLIAEVPTLHLPFFLGQLPKVSFERNLGFQNLLLNLNLRAAFLEIDRQREICMYVYIYVCSFIYTYYVHLHVLASTSKDPL